LTIYDAYNKKPLGWIMKLLTLLKLELSGICVPPYPFIENLAPTM